jgi:hypothetical protein
VKADRKMKKIFLMVVFCFLTGPLFAGTIAEGRIVSVSNVAYNQDQFAIWVEGTGPCVSGSAPLILFKPSAAANIDAFKRAYATALLAFSLNKHVQIYNYENDQCDRASYIQIYQ